VNTRYVHGGSGGIKNETTIIGQNLKKFHACVEEGCSASLHIAVRK
jgi:hypothetical protein